MTISSTPPAPAGASNQRLCGSPESAGFGGSSPGENPRAWSQGATNGRSRRRPGMLANELSPCARILTRDQEQEEGPRANCPETTTAQPQPPCDPRAPHVKTTAQVAKTLGRRWHHSREREQEVLRCEAAVRRPTGSWLSWLAAVHSQSPMEAAAVACRGGLLARPRPGSTTQARARVCEHGVGVGSALSAARRRLLVASLGVGEPLQAQTTAEGAVALEVDEDAVSAEILPPPDVPAAKTVRVMFVLKKQCAFGQQFLVVSDDPALGHWDPAKATALDWSDGHVWTVKTELPANKLIEFKFLLRDASGHVRWQHGANRILQTNDTQNTLVIHEDWDHAKNQKVTEEEDISIGAEDVDFLDDFAASNGTMVADKLDENVETITPVVADAPLHGEIMGAEEANQRQLILGNGQKILDEPRGEVSMVPQNGNPSDDGKAGRNADDTTLCQEGAGPLENNSNSIFENDLAWARKALQQLLRILGFQIGTTRT